MKSSSSSGKGCSGYTFVSPQDRVKSSGSCDTRAYVAESYFAQKICMCVFVHTRRFCDWIAFWMRVQVFLKRDVVQPRSSIL